jgi:hypothetical protein
VEHQPASKSTLDMSSDSETALEERRFQLDRLAFHWAVWQDESKAFHKSATGLALLMLGLTLFCFQTSIKLVVLGNSLELGTMSALEIHLSRLIVCLVAAAAGVRAIDMWVNLQRHRVPEDVQELLHNDWVGPLPFRKIGRWAQSATLLVFALLYGSLLFVMIRQTFFTPGVPSAEAHIPPLSRAAHK